MVQPSKSGVEAKSSHIIICTPASLSVRLPTSLLSFQASYTHTPVCHVQVGTAAAAVAVTHRKAVHIGSGGEAPILEHLGRHVAQRAVRLGAHVRHRRVQHSGQPKVCQLHQQACCQGAGPPAGMLLSVASGQLQASCATQPLLVVDLLLH